MREENFSIVWNATLSSAGRAAHITHDRNSSLSAIYFCFSVYIVRNDVYKIQCYVMWGKWGVWLYTKKLLKPITKKISSIVFRDTKNG